MKDFALLKKKLKGKRVVLISNREPYVHEKTAKGIKCEQAIGGLTSALEPVVKACHGLWIAWGSGNASFCVTDSKCKVCVPSEKPNFLLKRIKLSETELSRYYYGFSNRVLWPTFHLFLEKASFDLKCWKAYQKVNEKFAKAALEELRKDDWVWIHDYHLLLLPKLIRKEKKDIKIGFFSHIPWPPWEIFSTLPWRNELFEGMLGSDLIGFHTQTYVKNFIKCAGKLGFLTKKNKILHKRQTTVNAFPISIDYEGLSSYSSSGNIVKRAKTIEKALRMKHVIFGIDRLDYTKGIWDRLIAFEKFLEKYPEFHGKVTLLQIVTPSRTKVKEYHDIKRRIDETVGRINGRFRKIGWVPVHYFYGSVPKERLFAYFRIASVALITPLVDGMNLVAKEYVASKAEDGVLILSEFIGAAEELKEAILVNPRDTEQVADAIKYALEMPYEKRKERFLALKEKVKNHDVFWWANSFFEEWGNVYKPN